MSSEDFGRLRMKEVFGMAVVLKDLGYIGNLDKISPFLPMNAVLFDLSDGIYAFPDLIRDVSSKPQFPDLNFVTKKSAGDKVRAPPLARMQHFVNMHRSYRYFSKRNAMRTAAQLTDRLESSREYLLKRSRYAELQHRVTQLKTRLDTVTREHQQDVAAMKDLQAATLPRAKALRKAQISLISRQKRLAEDSKKSEGDALRLSDLSEIILDRRSFLISRLQSIFPLTLAPDLQSLMICGLPLPDTPDLISTDEEAVASALGLVSHVLCVLSRFYNVPLRYSIVAMGSRAYIEDFVTRPAAPILPLYSKGVVRKDFRDAVYLLNLNLRQMLVVQGWKPLGSHHTLPNLLALLNTNEAAFLLKEYLRIKPMNKGT